MEEDSTTGAADNQSDQQNADNQTDQVQATTDDNQTAKNGDNLETSTSTDESNDKDGDAPATKFDTDLDEWATKTGRKVPESDSERTLLQEIRDGQREYSRAKQAQQTTKDISKAIKDAKPADNKQGDDDDDEDPVAKRQDDLEARLTDSENLRLRSEYFTNNDVNADEAKIMGEILQEKVDRARKSRGDKAAQAAFDYWTDPDNLPDWHDLAKARLASTTDKTKIEEEAARKERARIAKESQANGSARNASNATTSDKTEDQKRLERFSNWD